MASEERFSFIRPQRPQLQPEPMTYVNGVAITVSPWDFCMMFSRAVPSEPLSADPEAQLGAVRREVPMVGEIVERIVMSPEHAKALAAQLTENVALFEAEFGEIPQPKQQPQDKPT